MLTIQVVTRNNADIIGRCLDSAFSVADEVVVGDMGSDDGTVEACRAAGARVVAVGNADMSQARNALLAEGRNMYLEPWEFVARGAEAIRGMDGTNAFYVVQGGFVSKQVRLWESGRFVNPVFERLAGCGEATVRPGVVVSSQGGPDARRANTEACRRWAERRPTSPEPHYYLACSLLAEGRTDEFLAEAVKYMAMDEEWGDSAILMNYYMARAEAAKSMFGEAYKRVVSCLARRPTYAELWCLLGDMLYSGGRFEKARHMYENARLMGRRRRSDDMFPIEVSKYGAYPDSMEEKCRGMAGGSLLVSGKHGRLG